MRAVKAFYRHPIKRGVFCTGGIGGSQYTEWRVGDEVKIEGKPVLCKNGIHFFRTEDLCFGLGLFLDEPVFCEVEILGEVDADTYKRVTNHIKILRYIPKKEWAKKIQNRNNSGSYNSGNRNSGDYNSGYSNSGHYNSGDRNSGHYNSGDRNSGHYNSGNGNSGDCNSGNYNSGSRNSGHYNSGDYNSGDRNSGHYNSGDRNSGHYNSGNGYINYFCNQTKYYLFDIEVEMIPDSVKYADMSWFSLEGKTYKEAWQKCPETLLNEWRKIPEFQTDEAKKKFKEITGLNL